MEEFIQTPLYPDPITPTQPIMPIKRNISKHIFRWLVGLAVVLVGISATLFYFGSSSFTESGITLTVTGPNQASVGDEVTYKVHIENNTKTALHSIKLSFTHPQSSAILKDGQIINSNGNVQVIDIEDLSAGASRDEEFHSFIVGDKGNIKVALAKLDFKVENIKSSFEKTAQFSTTISDTPVPITFVGPPTSVSGEAVTYLLDYRNQTQDDISGLQLVLSYPDGFRVTKVLPKATTGNTVWSLPLLKKGSGARIVIDGVLTGQQGDTKSFNVTLQRDINGTYVDYEKDTVTTLISSPLLKVSASVNGNANYISYPGDTLLYSIQYTNTSNFTFSGLTLRAKLSGSMYDLSSIDPRGGFYDSSTSTINWNSTVVPAFNALAPRATGVVVFSVKLKQTSGSSSNNTLAHATVTLETENVPDTISGNSVTVTNDILTKITSQPTFSQKAYYKDPSFGSSGPMPPEAGKNTVFTIHWLVTNPGNTVSNTKIVGTLPQGVIWKNIFTVGAGQPQPTFNKNTSQVIWDIGSLPFGVGTDGTLPYGLVFQVSVKPSPTQVGFEIPILTGARFSGVDSFTLQNIAITNLDINTNFTVDRPGEGVVQP